jgi:hypothetical protein
VAKVNRARIVPFAIAGIFAITAIRKAFGHEYIFAIIATVFAVIYLWFGLKTKAPIAKPLADSISDVSDFLAGSQDGTDL